MKIALLDWNFLFSSPLPGYLCNADHLLRLLTLKQTLDEQSAHEAILLPNEVGDMDPTPEAKFLSVWTQLEVAQPDVLGISVDSHSFDLSMLLAAEWKREFGIPIVLGGPHMQLTNVKQTKDNFCEFLFAQPILTALLGKVNKKPIVDFVLRGNATPLPELLDCIEQGKLCQEEGIYRFENEKLIGRGIGKHPKLSRTPVARKPHSIDDSFRLELAMDLSCPNKCDYCNATDDLHYPLEQTATAILEVAQGETPAMIALLDSNPLRTARRIAKYAKLMHLVEEGGLRAPYFFYLDPASLSEPDTKSALLAFTKNTSVGNYFIGRESANAQIAELLGRKYRGTPKTPELHTSEKTHIADVIRALSGDQGVTISYIGTPFDTSETFEETINEMEYFSNLAEQNNVRIDFVNGLIRPIPGTRFMERFFGDLFGHNLFYQDIYLAAFFEQSYPGYLQRSNTHKQQIKDRIEDRINATEHPPDLDLYQQIMKWAKDIPPASSYLF